MRNLSGLSVSLSREAYKSWRGSSLMQLGNLTLLQLRRFSWRSNSGTRQGSARGEFQGPRWTLAAGVLGVCVQFMLNLPPVAFWPHPRLIRKAVGLHAGTNGWTFGFDTGFTRGLGIRKIKSNDDVRCAAWRRHIERDEQSRAGK